MKESRRFAAGRTEANPSSSVDKLLPLTLTIPPRGGMPPATTAQSEQKFHRPFEVASRADAGVHRNKPAAKPQQSNNTTPDRPPPPLVHRTSSNRNGTTVDGHRRQPHDAARPDVKFGALSAASAADDTPLNLVVGRQSSSQHLSAAVNGSNSADLGQSGLQPSVVSDGWRRQRNQTENLPSSPLVSLLDRKSTLRAARKKSSAVDGNSSDEEVTGIEDGVAEAKRRARLLLITSGPPLKPDSSPPKINFLQQLGLVTSDARAGECYSEIVLLKLFQCISSQFEHTECYTDNVDVPSIIYLLPLVAY